MSQNHLKKKKEKKKKKVHIGTNENDSSTVRKTEIGRRGILSGGQAGEQRVEEGKKESTKRKDRICK